MKSVKIRNFNESDTSEVDNLVKDILLEIFSSRPQKLEELNNIRLFLVAEDNRKIVGTIALIEKDGDFVVKRLYVKKEYRNKGLAQKLYDKIENFAIKNKIKILKLSTTPEMKQAISFYEKKGYHKLSYNKETNQMFFEKEIK